MTDSLGEVTMVRVCHVVVGALLLMTAACSDTTTNVVNNFASVRLVNATDTPLSIAIGAVPDSANTRIVFGESSGCLLVDMSATTTPTLILTNDATGASSPFRPTLTPGAHVMVVAFGDTVGVVHLAPLSNSFAPATNGAGLRFFNGATTIGPLTMQRGGSTLTPPVIVGTASDFTSVPSDSARITFSNASSIVLDAGLMAFPLGQSSTVVVGPAAQGTNSLRFFTAQGC
jgi:hypothetical protein